MGYTAAFKEQMVRRMMGPPGMTATALSKEVGVSQTQLSRWLKQTREAASLETAEDKQGPQTSARKWTAEEKLRVLAVAHGLEGEALGALLRREGLHETQVETWREAAAAGLSEALSTGGMTAGQRRRAGASERRVRELEKELRRKEKALAEAAALLMLEKKLRRQSAPELLFEFMEVADGVFAETPAEDTRLAARVQGGAQPPPR